MTVQSIDNRVAPETNMTPAADKAQAATSVEAAFMAVLRQATQRFNANTTGGVLASDTMMAEHITRMVATTADKTPAARTDSQSDHAQVAKDPRAVGKNDKQRPGQSGVSAAKKADTGADAAAPAAAPSDTSAPAAVAGDDKAPKASSSQDDDKQEAQGNDQGKAPEPEVVAAVAQQEQVVVEIDITVTETVEVVQAGGPGQGAQADPGKLLQQAAAQGTQGATGPSAGNAQDPLAGLSKDDRQRIVDLQNRIVSDLQQGDADDALDAATQLVAQLVAKVGQHTVASLDTQQAGAQNDAAQAQADDLAAMLAGSDTQVAVKVQVTEAVATPQTQNAATVVDALTQMDLAIQGQQPSGQGTAQNQADQNGQAGGSGQDGAAATLQTTQVSAAAAQAAATPDDEVRVFSAVLAAQVEGNGQAAETVAQPSAVAGLASVGATQATDKPAPSQAAQGPRAPRVPLQQQVMEQINVQIDKAVKDGADTVKIQLKPLALGKIEVKLEVASDGHVTATVTADKPETLALLQKDAKGLEKALESAGLKPEANSTSFNLRGGEHQQNAGRGNNNQRSGGNRQQGQDAGGDANLAAGSVMAARSRGAGLRSGVDISV